MEVVRLPPPPPTSTKLIVGSAQLDHIEPALISRMKRMIGILRHVMHCFIVVNWRRR